MNKACNLSCTDMRVHVNSSSSPGHHLIIRSMMMSIISIIAFIIIIALTPPSVSLILFICINMYKMYLYTCSFHTCGLPQKVPPPFVCQFPILLSLVYPLKRCCSSLTHRKKGYPYNVLFNTYYIHTYTHTHSHSPSQIRAQ